MKSLIKLFLLTFSTTLLAQTSVEVPLFIDNNDELIPMEVINRHLGFSEENKFLEKLVVANNPISLKVAHDNYWDLYMKTQDLELTLSLDAPGKNHKENFRTCFRGNPAEAVHIISGLADSVYSDQLGIWGWRYRNEIHLINARSNHWLVQRSKEWRTFSNKSDAILILSHQSEDASDINAGYVVRCQK